MNRKVLVEGTEKWIPRQLVIITFEGNALPNYVFINSVQFVVEPYIGRVVQCYKCLNYGHVSSQCRSTKNLCQNCGNEKLGDHICNSENVRCIFCKNNLHPSNSKKCPYYESQKKIKEHMSRNNIPYFDAKEMVENSFSTIVTNNKFNILNNITDFPSLPIKENARKPNLSLSQPSTSFSSYQKSPSAQSNKKRKIVTPPVTSHPTENMFPFKFGPNKPLPTNQYKPPSNPIINMNNMTEYFSNCIRTIFKNIGSSNDFKNIDINILKCEFNRILEGILKNT